MNLYRNFGNLFESWVTEGNLDSHSQTGDGESDPGSRNFFSLSQIKSESEDSGFETVSTISPCHSHQVSQLTEPDNSFPEDDVRPSSSALSVCSSSSSCVSLGSVAPRNTCLKVEQALRRTEQTSGHVTGNRPQQQIENRLPEPRYRCNTASIPTSHTSNFRERHRLNRPRRINSQPPDDKKADLYRRRFKSHQNGTPVERQLELEEKRRLDELSPGLRYLEQVCRMLENIAKLQQQNHNLQEEVDILKSQHAVYLLRTLDCLVS